MNMRMGMLVVIRGGGGMDTDLCHEDDMEGIGYMMTVMNGYPG